MCQFVLLTLICQLTLTFMWSRGLCAWWSSPCMLCRPCLLAHPCISNKTSRRRAACSIILQVTIAQHLCPAAKTDFVYLFWHSVSSVPNAMVLVHCFISISNLYLACTVNNSFPLILCFNSRNFIVYIYTPWSHISAIVICRV